MSSDNNARLAKALKELKEAEFWGEVTITYRKGVPNIIRKSETIPLDGRTANANKDTHG